MHPTYSYKFDTQFLKPFATIAMWSSALGWHMKNKNSLCTFARDAIISVENYKVTNIFYLVYVHSPRFAYSLLQATTSKKQQQPQNLRLLIYPRKEDTEK